MRFADTIWPENVWLRATATQRGLSHMMHYNAAFYGTAALQAWKLGIDAPLAFWQAVGRAGHGVPERPNTPAPAAKKPAKAALSVVETAPKPAAKAPSPPPAKPAATAKPKALAKAKLSKPKAPAPKTKNKTTDFLDAPRGGKKDDLTVMAGVGDKLEGVMNGFGIFHFDQLAGLSEAAIDQLNTKQPGFKAVLKRFDLINQAKAQSA